jgi:hypothetical protein
MPGLPSPANQQATPVEYGGTDLAAVAAGAAGTVTATLTGTSVTTVHLTGFVVDGLGATAASVIIVTVAGLLGGSRLYRISVPVGATVQIPRLAVEFSRPIPASAVNTPITVSAASFGAGNTAADVAAHGFYR